MKIQTSWWRQRLIACDEISPTWEAPWDKPCLMYLDASVGAGQLGELDAAAVVHVPQTHLSENNGRNSKPSTSIKTSSESLLASWFSIWMILVQTAAAWVLRSTFSPKAAFQLFSCFVFECKKKTHPLSDALTMYCLSLHALALDRQVIEAVWPNNMARGQIWTEDKRREFSFSFFFFYNLATENLTEIWKKLTHLQLGRHVPQADLAVVAAGDDGTEVVHHQQAADAVCGSCAAP